MFETMMTSIPNAMLRYLTGSDGLSILLKLLGLFGFDTWKMFDQLGCDEIYEDAAVCSARSSGVRGIGTELCKRTEELARDLGCTHTYAAVTGRIVS